jgi:hypothetical protein
MQVSIILGTRKMKPYKYIQDCRQKLDNSTLKETVRQAPAKPKQTQQQE